MKELILLITAAGLLALAHLAGVLEAVFTVDATGITYTIAALGAGGTLLARLCRGFLRWVCDQGVTVTLGLLGTVIGFMAALSGIVSADDTAKFAGVETALATTVVGVIAHLWLLVVREVTRD